jgi:hypothetical protein
MRVLVALEDEYRVYRDMIAAATAVLRPQSEVETTGLDELGEQVRRFDPQVVVCSRDKPGACPPRSPGLRSLSTPFRSPS